ncbi:HpcH/HpaI aldolase [Methylorubrum populi]|uniref:HpcH/HpaI aldolase n=1 Tax=Methylorubrum populi TaxID=223967 RepID=A0A160PEM4_9HYPH|nr:aldolase [Methylorubrum populi]BAU91024.1 HpcH/HpaI aldolase [Methylorubrum populi]
MSAPEPAGPGRDVIAAKSTADDRGPAAGAALVFEGASLVGAIADLRARRPGLAIYAALDGPDDPRLDGLMVERPDGVLLRDARSGRDVAALGGRLAVCEALAGLPDGATMILAAIGHPLGVLDARSFAGASPRLAGLGLDGTGPAAGLLEAGGLVRLAAAAAGVPVFERLTAGADRLPEGLAATSQDGFRWVVLRDPASGAARSREGAG